MLKNVLFAVLTLCITLIAFYWSGSSLSWAVSWLPFNRRNRLVVAVLSARSHFTNRDAIRRTWASDKANQDIRVLFFVGDNSCPIPRSHLQHLYACSARLVRPDELSQKVHSLQSHTLIGNHESLPAVDRRQMYGGFAFRTLFNIRLQAVGVLECVFANRKHVKSISIQLRDAFTQVINFESLKLDSLLFMHLCF